MSIININDELFQKNVIESGKPVLLEFWAPWCVYCRRIAPALQKVAEQFADTLVTGQVNIDEYPQLAERERIELVPTFLLYKDGKVLGSIVAPDSKAKIEDFINRCLNG